MSFNQLLTTFVIPPLLVFGTLDRIQKALEKSEFDKAEELILKGYEKEPGNPGISYYHASLLFTSTYEKFNPDSARIVISTGRFQLTNASEDFMEDVLDAGLTEEHFIKLSTEIRDYLFQETLKNLSTQSIKAFQNKYPQSIYEDILVFKHDSIVYDRVLHENTEAAYTTFISEYPTSVFKPEADSLLDGLRFQRLKKTGNLKDYYSFLKSYPLTRWTSEIETYILKVSTASHFADRYATFIRDSKTIDLQRKAADILYYIDPEAAFRVHPRSDSVQLAHEFNQVEVFPMMDRNRFGFYNATGVEQIAPAFNEITDAIKCATTNDDLLFVKIDETGNLITKNNRIVISDVMDYKPLSNGLALVMHQNQWYLYHRSGFRVLEQPVTNAQVLGNKWIKVQSGKKWGLYTFLGVPIAETKYDDIFVSGTFWIFEKDDLFAAYTEELILKEVEDRGLSLEFKFDDIELVDSTMLIGFRGERECLMDNQLNFLIPWGEYEIYPDPSGWYLKSDDGYLLYNNTDERIIDKYFPYLESNPGWLALKTENDWMLIPRFDGLSPSQGYDSIKLVNPYASLLMSEDGKKLLFSSGKELEIEEHNIKAFINHPEYLSIRNEGALGIYDQQGELVFDGMYEEATFINDTLFKVTSDKNQGLVHTNGTFVLNPIFESMDEKNGLILTLLKGRIGCYDLFTNTLIPPQYESRITKIDETYLVKKEGKYGLINGNEDEVLSFAYETIQQWNDTSYLVSTEGIYHIVDSNEEMLFEEIDQLKLLYEQSDQRLYKYVKEGKFGLISNTLGVILKPEFTDIINIGNADHPLFFADQHLNKAGFHVVSYINEGGKLIYSKAYRREEFDRILCDD